MLKTKRDRYKSGYLRKVQRAKGFAWEYRVNVIRDGVPKTEYLTLSGAEFPTERAARQKLQGLVLKVNEGKAANFVQVVTLGTILDRFIAEEMPRKASTIGSYKSLIERHIRPKWGAVGISEVKPGQIRLWLQSLPLAPLTLGHIRSLLHKMFDLAMIWEYLPFGRNPIELVKITGVTKREKEVVILSPEQAMAIIQNLPEPYSLMVMTVAALGIRLGEMLALRWEDFDMEGQTVTIRRSTYRGTVDDAKTAASHAELPLPDDFAVMMTDWRDKSVSGWVFPNPATDKPYAGPSLQQQWLRPAGEKIGIKGVGFHTFRHSHKTWLDSIGTPMGVMKDLLRHSSISVTMNVYGKTMSKEKRHFNNEVNKLLFPTAS